MPYRVDSPVPVRELPGEAVPYVADGDGRAICCSARSAVRWPARRRPAMRCR